MTTHSLSVFLLFLSTHQRTLHNFPVRRSGFFFTTRALLLFCFVFFWRRSTDPNRSECSHSTRYQKKKRERQIQRERERERERKKVRTTAVRFSFVRRNRSKNPVVTVDNAGYLKRDSVEIHGRCTGTPRRRFHRPKGPDGKAPQKGNEPAHTGPSKSAAVPFFFLQLNIIGS